MKSLLRWLVFNRRPSFCVFSFALWTAVSFPTQEQLPHVSCKYNPHLLTFHQGFAWWGQELSQPFKCCWSVVQSVQVPQPGGVSMRFHLAKQSGTAACSWSCTSATSLLPKWASASHAPAWPKSLEIHLRCLHSYKLQMCFWIMVWMKSQGQGQHFPRALLWAVMRSLPLATLVCTAQMETGSQPTLMNAVRGVFQFHAPFVNSGNIVLLLLCDCIQCLQNILGSGS